jgi:hypothetical protein
LLANYSVNLYLLVDIVLTLRWYSHLILLEEMPDQKADGLAKLFSGFATFCNKIGHHRDRSQRDAAGNLTAMPLNHSEANIAVAIAQYILMYPLRLWTEGILPENPSDLNSQTQHDT